MFLLGFFIYKLNQNPRLLADICVYLGQKFFLLGYFPVYYLISIFLGILGVLEHQFESLGIIEFLIGIDGNFLWFLYFLMINIFRILWSLVGKDRILVYQK